MSRVRDFIREHLLFACNIFVLCLMALALLFLIRYPMQGQGLLFRALSSVVFIIIFGWKIFFIFVIGTIGLNLMDVLKHADKYKSGVMSVTKREVIFLSLGLAISMMIGFIFSTGIRTGKSDIEPTLFLSYFNVIFVLFLITRVGIGLLLHTGSVLERFRGRPRN